MEKNRQPELQLSEEQLQEITGGCAICDAYTAAVALHQNYAKTYTNLALIAIAGQAKADATRYTGLAKDHLNQAQQLMNAAASRHLLAPAQ